MNTTTKTAKTITIFWSAFSHDTGDRVGRRIHPETQMTFGDWYADGTTDFEICEELFRDFNFYTGKFKTFKDCLPTNRSHTALSVGDKIRIDYKTYVCTDTAWEEI